jgi:hypothetical protein
MVEALQSRLMVGSMESIPIQYNSYILHLVEGFAKQKRKIRATEEACTKAEEEKQQLAARYQAVADEWLERETAYRAEIKRLEVLLSRTSQKGLEAVTLARANSVVDRDSQKVKEFLGLVKDISDRADKTGMCESRLHRWQICLVRWYRLNDLTLAQQCLGIRNISLS